MKNENNLKPLHSVTLEDAKTIAQAGAVAFSRPYKWDLVDKSKDLNEPCFALESKSNHFSMWFYNDKIDVEHTSFSDADSNSLMYCHAPIECYVAAHNLGYLVPAFKDIRPHLEAEPDIWKDAPEWAEWRTVDDDETITFWATKPYPNIEDGTWTHMDARAQFKEIKYHRNDWAETLQQRPKQHEAACLPLSLEIDRTERTDDTPF